MKIIEYEDVYLEDVRDLLVELEEYIVTIDEDNLDQVGEEYREKMAIFDLKEVKENNGKVYLAVENDNVVGLIMGIIRHFDEVDYLDYKCPHSGVITEFIVSKNARNGGVGTMLINKIEEYFKLCGCEYIFVDVFAYNKNAIKFYQNKNFHSRMYSMIKEIK